MRRPGAAHSVAWKHHKREIQLGSSAEFPEHENEEFGSKVHSTSYTHMPKATTAYPIASFLPTYVSIHHFLQAVEDLKLLTCSLTSPRRKYTTWDIRNLRLAPDIPLALIMAVQMYCNASALSAFSCNSTVALQSDNSVVQSTLSSTSVLMLSIAHTNDKDMSLYDTSLASLHPISNNMHASDFGVLLDLLLRDVFSSVRLITHRLVPCRSTLTKSSTCGEPLEHIQATPVSILVLTPQKSCDGFRVPLRLAPQKPLDTRYRQPVILMRGGKSEIALVD
ncbi:hypothetical protein CSKR_103479 [Clonorchis sinensis]|uniref:Uncharacterized protein n=2 Tax=Clonorchis sinensis TaxID=79923 RepID=G7YUJ7_CLOSI|nr:hypothetical protein CSKR_103479 [Clonorchis sinensis]GAA56627.1 hypothetical protein CLF_111263 [Clonorchis sinensis]